MEKVTSPEKEAIDRFLADNPELEELSTRLSVFNIFHTLRIEEAEIRHSNVLAWLLDPSESHGLSDIVLRRILSNILLQSSITIKNMSAAKVELMDFNSVEVQREWKNIDILVVDNNNKFVLLIENKIYAQESEGQLNKYLAAVRDEFPDHTVIPVFLTLMGNEAEDEQSDSYISYSYSNVLTVLEKIFSQRKTQLAEPVAIFLSQYLEVLRRLTMQDEDLVKLCKAIYKKHRDAIDLIVEYGMVGAGQQAVEEVLAEEGGYEVLYSSPSWVCFIPKSWAEHVPENSLVQPKWTRPFGAACWFMFPRDPQRVYLAWEASAMSDSKLRQKCMIGLQTAGFKMTKAALGKDAKYSRFYRDNIKVSDLTDQEEVKEAVKKLLDKGETKLATATEVFSKVFK